ncbi:MAG TPA: glycerol kinase GlpK [Proteiniclasticum sp.]|nr:glycerol kinase GlpK [Proteiniclasticum sp.]
MDKFLLVLDQGTTSSRATIYNNKGEKVSYVNREFKQHYPKPGWVEHDPKEIIEVTFDVARLAIDKAGLTANNISAIGITNQRETSVMWNKNTGEPLYNAIVWGCRRTTEICKKLMDDGHGKLINEKTGLVIDPVYSGTKIRWILDNVDGVKELAEKGDVLFGTIDTWLLWNLTKGKVHATDQSNGSRTMLLNIHEGKWDDELLKLLDIPKNILPEVRNSIDDYGYSDESIFGAKIPITGVAGDQQAALFGQACFEEGEAKCTYGTSNVPLVFLGNKVIPSEKGLITLAWGIEDKISYAMGASIFTTGSAIKWLRDNLELVESAAETETLANSVEDTQGIYFVTAFQGLGAPHWDMYARGMLIGVTAGVTKAHIARATLESIAYQTRDLIEAIASESGTKVKVLKVDGGAVVNDYLMQFQADILNVPVERPKDIETTSLGAAFMAGLGVGVWKSFDEVKAICEIDKTFYPKMDEETREELYSGWKRAVEYSKGWLKKD